ncbi:cytochrome P450 [Artemisia annua]|uniref:Cytochrome P450 n=1 Tax=Artemisia annua TaxID=35608 RepID=A0A2U1NY43_ARTAN|nr:cytochrome P450 [Artemisia annua]
MVVSSTWLGMVVGLVPLVGWLLWWWNDIWYGLIIARGNKLPPGYMGLPIIGEMFTFLWFFKFIRRPDDFINSKRNKYGDGVGMYRTHLFGKPSVIVFLPAVSKFVFRDDKSFILKWPNIELVGETSVVSVHGSAHKRLRSFVSRSINQPDALRGIAVAVQPRMISALDSWAKDHKIIAYNALKKVTFENIGMYFASFEPGPILDKLDEYFAGMVKGFRASRLNIPGSTFYHALQCRKRTMAIFKEELDKRKKNHDRSSRPINDLLDGLMNLKDDEGNYLSETEILDNIVSLLVAGYESTVIVTTWAIYFLAKYPQVLQKLRDENMPLKKSKNGELATSDEIMKLKYTSKVVEETIRMTNVVPFVLRTTTKSVEYKGYTIPKGWNMIMWVRYLHTNAENFNDPMSFNPDRWDVSMSPITYQPFGGGSRLCAGNMLARLQLGLFLHHLATGYKWELVNPDAKVRYLSHPMLEDHVEITIEKL